MLVKISFDGNNTIHQKSVMNERDCNRIADDADMRFESVIDIFYNTRFEFDDYNSNLDAARKLKGLYPKPSSVFF